MRWGEDRFRWLRWIADATAVLSILLAIKLMGMDGGRVLGIVIVLVSVAAVTMVRHLD